MSELTVLSLQFAHGTISLHRKNANRFQAIVSRIVPNKIAADTINKAIGVAGAPNPLLSALFLASAKPRWL